MRELTGYPHIHAQVATRTVNGCALIVLADAGEVLVLNRSATALWQWVDGHHSGVDLATRLSYRYDLPAAQACADVGHLLALLAEAGAIEIKQHAL